MGGFPVEKDATHALCNPTLKRDCYAYHCAGRTPTHKSTLVIKKKESKKPPGEKTRESPRQKNRTRPRADPGSPGRAL